MRYKLIDAEKEQIPISRSCHFLNVSVSGYYAWRSRGASKHQQQDMLLLAYIREFYALSHGTYGSPRMTIELQEAGFTVGRRRVARLMQENGLKARVTRRFKRTTDSHHTFAIAPNLLGQDFEATGPDQKWAGDISYIWTREGWLYLAVMLDLYSRRVIGWATSDRLKTDLAITALNRALALRGPVPGVIHHSDRGSQYCAHDYQKKLKVNGLIPSMSGKGNCYDNAVAESFFKTLKTELVWRTSFSSRLDAKIMIGKYIDGFYNSKRRHSFIGYKSPIAFENMAT